MKVLNLLGAGNIGGIEKLCEDIAAYADYENTFVFLFEEGVVYNEMKAAGYDVHSLAEYGDKKVNPERMNALAKLAADYDIIIVHHNALAIQMLYVKLKKQYPLKKFILTAHSCFELDQYKSIKNPIRRWLRFRYQKQALAVSDMIIFVSNAGKKSYLSYYDIPECKIQVVYNGIVLPKEPQVLKFSKTNEPSFSVTYIGRLVEEKGVQNLIEAVALLKERDIECKVAICGDGDYRSTLEALSKTCNVAEQIHFHGVQRNIAKYLKETDIFVYPSICEEVFGISIVEALSYGVPCAVNRVGGVPEIITDGWNGTIAAEKTAEALSSAIERITRIYQSREIEEMSQHCFETAEKFTIQNTVAGIKMCCEAVMKGGQR